MNRRGFVARSAAMLGALMASCQFMPELASAQTKRLGQEPRILDVLADEMERAKKVLPPATVLDLLDCIGPFSYRVNLVRFEAARFRDSTIIFGAAPRRRVLRLEIDPLWTEAEIRRAFKIELSRAVMSFVDPVDRWNYDGEKCPDHLMPPSEIVAQRSTWEPV